MVTIMGGTGAAMGLWGVTGAMLAIAVLLLAGRLAQPSGARRHRTVGGRPVTVDTPWEILRRRYAAGEIGDDEYRRRLAGLSEYN